MAAPYRRVSQNNLLWIATVFIGIGCAVGLSFVLPKDGPWWVLMPVFMAPVLLAIGAAVWLMFAIHRRRIAAIQSMLERGAFVMDIEPDASRKAAVFAPVADLGRRLNLPNGAQGIEWVALHARQPSSQAILEHLHTTGSGKYMQEHRKTIIAWLAPSPSSTGVSEVSTYRPHWLQGRALKRRPGLITLGDERFDRAWITFGDPSGARVFLTESLRLILADSPKGESWHVGGNWIACVYDGAVNATNMAKLKARCENVVNHSGLARMSVTR